MANLQNRQRQTGRSGRRAWRKRRRWTVSNVKDSRSGEEPRIKDLFKNTTRSKARSNNRERNREGEVPGGRVPSLRRGQIRRCFQEKNEVVKGAQREKQRNWKEPATADWLRRSQWGRRSGRTN